MNNVRGRMSCQDRRYTSEVHVIIHVPITDFPTFSEWWFLGDPNTHLEMIYLEVNHLFERVWAGSQKTLEDSALLSEAVTGVDLGYPGFELVSTWKEVFLEVPNERTLVNLKCTVECRYGAFTLLESPRFQEVTPNGHSCRPMQ